MKSKLLLLSSTLLLLSSSAFADDEHTNSPVNGTSNPNVVEYDGTQVRTVTPDNKSFGITPNSSGLINNNSGTSPATVTTRKYGKGLQIPPPPKETTPGNVRLNTNNVSSSVTASSQSNANRQTSANRSGASTVTVLGTGGPHIAKNTQVQRFPDYLNIQPGMDTAPLTMTINNQGFKWFRVLINNELIATDQSLAKQTSGEINLTGVVGSGSNQIVVQAGGMPGSKIDWKVTTLIAAKLDHADPDEGLANDIIKITGKHFSSKISDDKITFNGKTAHVVSAKETAMQVKIPFNADLGDNKVVGEIRGVKTNAIKVKVVAVPEVTGTNMSSAPPGFHITIYGKNFAKSPGENKVYLGDQTASVLNGDTSHLTVVVPSQGNGTFWGGENYGNFWGGLNWTRPDDMTPNMGSLQVKVQVGKLVSKENVSFTIGRQIYPGIENPNGEPSVFGKYNVGPGTDNPMNPPGQGPNYGAAEPSDLNGNP